MKIMDVPLFFVPGDLLNGTYANGKLLEQPISADFRDVLFPGAARGLEYPGVVYRGVRSQHGEIIRTDQFMFYSAEHEASIMKPINV